VIYAGADICIPDAWLFSLVFNSGHFRSLPAFITFRLKVLNLLTFSQCFVTVALNGTIVNKNVFSRIVNDKTVPLSIIEPTVSNPIETPLAYRQQDIEYTPP